MLQYIYTSPFPLTQASSSRRTLRINTDIGGQSGFFVCLLCLQATTREVSASVSLIIQTEVPFVDWKQMLMWGGYYAYTTQNAKSTVINLRQQEAKIRLNAVLQVSAQHMETPTHFLSYCSFLSLLFNNGRRRLLTALLIFLWKAPRP